MVERQDAVARPKRLNRTLTVWRFNQRAFDETGRNDDAVIGGVVAPRSFLRSDDRQGHPGGRNPVPRVQEGQPLDRAEGRVLARFVDV